MMVQRNIVILFIVYMFLFSCRKENVSGTYVEVNEDTKAVTYYKVQLDCNILLFQRINEKIGLSYANSSTFTPVYDKAFSYELKRDSFKIIKLFMITFSLNNPGYEHYYHMGKVSFYKNKIIITGQIYSIKFYHYPYVHIDYTDTTRYTRKFYKANFKNDYVKFIR